MASTLPTVESDAWKRLELYRQRYEIEGHLEAVESLERSIRRRQSRLDGVRRHVEQLEAMLADSRREFEAIEGEIEESRRVGSLLIEEIIDQVRIDHGEAWTPIPVRGFRAWVVKDDGLYGAKLPWPTATMDAVCLTRAPGDDIPHTRTTCGPPSCGIYATKRLDLFNFDGRRWFDTVGAMGVVAMAGKVVEHEDGYRCARATVEALVVQLRNGWLMSDDPVVIEAAFADPEAAVRQHGEEQWREESEATEFLTSAKQKEETWT